MKLNARNSVIALVLAAVSVTTLATIAYAAPSCTQWMDQGNGTSWRECVNDDGTTHCYVINNTAGSVAREVKCE
jgi:hypothetical protein